MTKSCYPNRQFIFLYAFLVIINLIAIMPAAALADLPPRPGSPPPSPEVGSDSNGSDPIGGYIALRLPVASPGVWTMVQWQDQAGAWHDIEGWQGTLDDDQQKVWWIDPADFGKGPFRWVVYQSQNGKLLADSASFNLPSAAYETVSVEIDNLPKPAYKPVSAQIASLPTPTPVQPDEPLVSQPASAETTATPSSTAVSLPTPTPVQPDELLVSQPASAETTATPSSTAVPDFLPTTGAEIETIESDKLVLAWGVLLLLLGRAAIVVFKAKRD